MERTKLKHSLSVTNTNEVSSKFEKDITIIYNINIYFFSNCLSFLRKVTKPSLKRWFHTNPSYSGRLVDQISRSR